MEKEYKTYYKTEERYQNQKEIKEKRIKIRPLSLESDLLYGEMAKGDGWR